MDRPSQEMRAPALSGTRNTLGARRTKMRVLHRRSQGIVAVYEQDPTVDDTTPKLVFESPAKCTRVTQYPAEWQRLSDDELVALQRAAG
jgi:hypothetical protein